MVVDGNPRPGAVEQVHLVLLEGVRRQLLDVLEGGRTHGAGVGHQLVLPHAVHDEVVRALVRRAAHLAPKRLLAGVRGRVAAQLVWRAETLAAKSALVPSLHRQLQMNASHVSSQIGRVRKSVGAHLALEAGGVEVRHHVGAQHAFVQEVEAALVASEAALRLEVSAPVLRQFAHRLAAHVADAQRRGVGRGAVHQHLVLPQQPPRRQHRPARGALPPAKTEAVISLHLSLTRARMLLVHGAGFFY
jgi:hypothetical protein